MTKLPEGVFDADISDKEFRVLAVLCHLTGQEGTVQASVAEIGYYARASKSTVLRALSGLSRAGLVGVERTRRENGYRGVNVYRVQGVTTDTLPPNPGVTHDTTTAGKQSNESIDDYKSVSTGKKASPSYLGLRPFSNSTKEVSVMARNNDYDEDDGILGIGALFTDASAVKKKKRTSSKTRADRPVAEWSAQDVAAEFNKLAMQRVPAYGAYMNTLKNGIALAGKRKVSGTTPESELELARLFLDDPRRLTGSTRNLFEEWLSAWGELMERDTEVREEPEVGYILSSDGKKFVDNPTGRALLRRYESTLGGGK